MPKLICISGSSGVGKTTLSKLFEYVIGSSNEVVVLSGDDHHKWERNDPQWNTITHLNPKANNLDVGHSHIASLMEGKSIQRQIYNHDTGKFNLQIVVEPKQYIIYEGLHSMYRDDVNAIADIRIFVDTNPELKVDWKVTRDVKKRGYTREQVIDTILLRKKDEEEFINPQHRNADIVVKFDKNKNNAVSLEYINITGRGEDLMSQVKEFYDSMNDFVDICKWLSLDPSLTQGRGGNVSIKSRNGLIVKASGYNMADINLFHGFCVCNIPDSIPLFNSELEYMQYINSTKRIGKTNPSMETGFHMSMADRVIAHTHPIHLNAILCSREAVTIVEEIFQDLAWKFIEYTRPGMNLVNRLRENTTPECIFLENHGLIVRAGTIDSAMTLTSLINDRCKKWLSDHSESLVDSDQKITHYNMPLFPDAAVLSDEMSSTNEYILRLMTVAGLTPKFLDNREIDSLNSMDSEKYRKTLL